MIKLQDVSYVRLGTANLDGAAQFAILSDVSS